MTHTKPLAESEGEFTGSVTVERPCSQCQGKVMCETWESSDGAYEDYKYTCLECGLVWWVDGIDS